MRRLSSDTAAKVSTVAVIIVVVIAAGVVAVAAATVLMNSDTESYSVTISVDAMDVATDSGYVYNVMNNGKYFNPNNGHFDRNDPSNIAVLYLSATMGSKTNYSNDAVRVVQTSTEATPSETITGNTLGFKVRTSDSEMKMSVFLLLKGTSHDSSGGTIIDIYDKAPGESGISLSIDMKDNSEVFELKGNAQSSLRGYAKITVTVSS